MNSHQKVIHYLFRHRLEKRKKTKQTPTRIKQQLYFTYQSSYQFRKLRLRQDTLLQGGGNMRANIHQNRWIYLIPICFIPVNLFIGSAGLISKCFTLTFLKQSNKSNIVNKPGCSTMIRFGRVFNWACLQSPNQVKLSKLMYEPEPCKLDKRKPSWHLKVLAFPAWLPVGRVSGRRLREGGSFCW